MSENAFDRIARQTANDISRRHSLLALGGAALAASLSSASVAKAGTAGKKAKKKCKKQGPACQQFANDLCDLFFDPGTELDECIDSASDCCSPLTRCAAGEFFSCALGVIVVLT